MSTVNSSVAKLRELAPSLNKAADDAARIVQEVENVLTKELSLGINVRVIVRSVNLSKTKTEYTELAHTRVAGKFRIAVVESRATSFADEHGFQAVTDEILSETAWAECPRDVKLETFPAMPKLLEAIIKKVEEAKATVEKTQQIVREILGPPSTAPSPEVQESAKPKKTETLPRRMPRDS